MVGSSLKKDNISSTHGLRIRQPFFSFIDPGSLWPAESSGSQPVYRKLFPHGLHSSKNNFFEIKISQRRDWESPSPFYYGSWLYIGQCLDPGGVD